MKRILIALALFAFSSVAFADNCKLGPCNKADLETCVAKLKGQSFTVKNCVSESSCATTADPGFAVEMVCDYTGSAWAYRTKNATLDAEDATDYAELAGATFTGPIQTTLYERKVTNVTVADDGAGTKPTGAIPITTDFVTCTCNDATGCTMSIAEPTPTSGYGRSLTVVSIGTGNCEISDSSGVVEVGTGLVIEPTSTASFAYVGSAWYNVSYKDNVPEVE